MPEPVLIPIPIDEQRYDSQKDLKNSKIKVEAEGTEVPNAKAKDDSLFKTSDSSEQIQDEIGDIFANLPKRKKDDDERTLSNGNSKGPYLKIDL